MTVSDTNSSYRTGFQLTATAGTLKAATSTTVITSTSGKQYVTHSNSATSYTFDWTAPSSGDSVTVYLAGAAASGTRQTNVYTSVVTLTRAAVRPAISAGGVVNAASYVAGISAGSWVTIYGTNLASAGVSRAWTAADIVNGKLPTTLEGTAVRINGKYAAIAYVSESQLNVQAPDDTSTGTVAVDVTTSGGTSDAVTADLRSAAPGIFRFSPSSAKYAAAVFADGSLAAPVSLFGSSATSRPAQPGETVLLFGTGFGATTPAVSAGATYSGAAPLASGANLVVKIGGAAADVAFAGISAPGLYQFNVVVPNLSDGEYLVEASAWGQNVPTQQYLAVKR
ncbi:MAG: IPT/TIG domain-containing protein [Acidobacteria bacterium]|nr:IPT/TIG domain-containing protein [Acidobacteriota bacterium]